MYLCTDQYQLTIGVGVSNMWEVQKLSELVMKFRKIKSSSSQDNPSALSETSKPSDLSDFIKFRSEIAELQKNLEDLLLRVWKLQGSQGNLPGSYITDLISMMRDLVCLDIKSANTYTVTALQQTDNGMCEVKDICPSATLSQ